MIASFLFYIAAFVAALGAISTICPLRLIGITTRASGVLILGCAFLAIVIALAWPASETRIAAQRTHLDAAMPVWQFNELHATHVAAPPEKVFAAIRRVRAKDILFFRTLIAIRRMGRPTPVGILNAPEDEPLLDIATRTSFRYLADDPPRELVVATTVARGIDATMNFLVAPDGRGGSNLSTETRVFAKSPRGRQRFAIYWRIIRPGSDIIRRMWLRAIKIRAEG